MQNQQLLMLFGALSQGAAGSLQLATLDDIVASEAAGNGFTPIASLRLTVDGKAQTAIGNESAILVYSQVGTDFLVPLGDASSYEAQLVLGTPTGDAGTFGGATTGSYISLASQRTWIWQKDADTAGTATQPVTLSIRETLNPSNIVTKEFDFVATEEP